MILRDAPSQAGKNSRRKHFRIPMMKPTLNGLKEKNAVKLTLEKAQILLYSKKNIISTKFDQQTLNSPLEPGQ